MKRRDGPQNDDTLFLEPTESVLTNVSVCGCVNGCVCVPNVGQEEEYLHSQTVIRHRHAGVAVPAHMHGGVGTVVCLLVQ